MNETAPLDRSTPLPPLQIPNAPQPPFLGAPPPQPPSATRKVQYHSTPQRSLDATGPPKKERNNERLNQLKNGGVDGVGKVGKIIRKGIKNPTPRPGIVNQGARI
jgi:hypothetical protein